MRAEIDLKNISADHLVYPKALHPRALVYFTPTPKSPKPKYRFSVLFLRIIAAPQL